MNLLNIDEKQLMEFANNYIDNEIKQDSIWRLCEKGVLYKFFKTSEIDNSDYLMKFEALVNGVLNKQINTKKINRAATPLAGKWLILQPAYSMFDGLAATESSGFFDSDDVPPPEFWVSYSNKILVSFVPENFLNLAISGVDVSISGSLYWKQA